MSESKKSFVHMHVHSVYSILDGISRRTDLIAKAKEDGQVGLSITDHGNMMNMVSFYRDCIPYGIKPIIGSELYMAPDSRFNKIYSKKDQSADDAKRGDLTYYAYHLTVLAKNREGYENLKTVSSLAYREGFYKKPRADEELLTAHKNGLIVLSGCLASKISRLLVAGQKELALAEVDKMRNIFGEDFYLEVMHHNIEEEVTVREALIDFAKLRGIGLIYSGDSHYTHKDDAQAHEVALAIGTGKTVDQQERFKFNGDGYWFKTADEMWAASEDANIPAEALTNTVALCDRIEDYGFKLVSKTKKSIIRWLRDESGKPISDEDCHALLDWKAHEGLVTRGLNDSEVHRQRLDRELATIKEKNFSSYFLIIADIIENAMRKKGILPPIGRGSSVGSLACYCMYIVGLDAIEHNLPFERFINPGRKDLPDIDTDISQKHRKEVINYIADKYGHDRVAQIVTFQSMAAKAAADNVGRALGVPSTTRRELGKLIGDLTKDDKLLDVLASNKAASLLMKQTPDWIDISARLEGNNRNLGAHAAGIVISNEPIMDHVPLIRDSDDGHMVTQYDMWDLSELGLLKLDMLGLKTMDLIQDTLEMVNLKHGIDLDYQKIPLDDKVTYDLVASAKFVSVFQYDSSGIRGVAKALEPVNFEHLVALNALYRPGPMLEESGDDGKSMMQNYIDRRHGREPVQYWHKDLEPIFKDTFGIALFQEQVMKISQVIGGFNDEEADEYRSAIGKKDAVKFKAVQDKLLLRGVEKGYTHEFMVLLTNKLQGSARYNWNRSHAVGYSYLSYVTAWLETHYPAEYYTTLLNVNLDDTDQLKVLLSSILQKGVKLTTPHINNSASLFHTDAGVIYMGLYSVRQLGEGSVTIILEDRVKNGPYLDYIDFCIRMSPYGRVNKLVKENLVKAGAFDWDISMTKRDMVENTELIQATIRKFSGKIPTEEIRDLVVDKLMPLSCQEYNEAEKLDYEKSVLNFYISSHPVMRYQPLLGLFENINFITPSQLNDTAQSTRVVMMGVVESRSMKQTKNGDPYLQLRLGDQVGNNITNIWSPLATRVNGHLVDNQLALLSGQVREDKFKPGENQLSVYGAIPITVGNGIPIKGAYVQEAYVANRLVNIFGQAADITENVLHHGHIVTFKSMAYMKPEHFSELWKLRSLVRYEIAL